MRVLELKENYPAYQAQGLEVLGFFQSPPESVEKHIRPLEPPFTVAPDPEHRVYNLYNVERSWWGLALSMLRLGRLAQTIRRGLMPGKPEGATHLLPADFLINEDLTIGQTFYATDITEHMPLPEIAMWAGMHAKSGA